MSITPSLPSYSEVASALTKTQAAYNAAQVHGLMCGLICATSGKNDNPWEAILFGHKKNKTSSAILTQLYEVSYHQMSEFSFEFAMLLPPDDAQIEERTEALGLWCQGFLTGLEQCKIPLENRPAGEITEAIDDLIEISQVNHENIPADEEDETAYFELMEYVRLAVLMIFHELKSGSVPSISSENNLLH